MRFTRLIIISALCLLMPISKAMAQDQYFFVDHKNSFTERDMPSGFTFYETEGAPLAVQNRTGSVFALDSNNRVTGRTIGSAVYGDHFETTPNGYKVYETMGAPIAIGADGTVHKAEYSRDLRGWDVSGGRIGAVSDVGAGGAGLNSVAGYVEHTYNSAEYGLISTSHNNPEGFANLERFLRETGQNYEAMDLVDQPLPDFIQRDLKSAIGKAKEYIDNTIVETVGRPFKTLENGFQLYEVEYGYPVAVDPRTGIAYATDGNHNMINDQVGRVKSFVNDKVSEAKTTAESVINKFTRLGSATNSSRGSATSANPYLYRASTAARGGPLSISQYLSGRATESSTAQRRRANPEAMQWSLALSPDQVHERRRAIREAREAKQRTNRR